MNIPIGPLYTEMEPTPGFTMLATNPTLMVLSAPNTPYKHTIVPDEWKDSTEKVMEYLKPFVKVPLQLSNSNRVIHETITFSGGIEAFSPESFIELSPTLRAMKAEKGICEQLIDMIDKNDSFRNALNAPEGLSSLIAVLEHYAAELDF